MSYLSRLIKQRLEQLEVERLRYEYDIVVLNENAKQKKDMLTNAEVEHNFLTEALNNVQDTES